jgi:hypothetical protein
MLAHVATHNPGSEIKASTRRKPYDKADCLALCKTRLLVIFEDPPREKPKQPASKFSRLACNTAARPLFVLVIQQPAAKRCSSTWLEGSEQTSMIFFNCTNSFKDLSRGVVVPCLRGFLLSGNASLKKAALNLSVNRKAAVNSESATH